ncbi:MAG: hypothetical protein AAGA80_26515, partial [Cyanobacteria bacterium P01_F01_bin.143]
KDNTSEVKKSSIPELPRLKETPELKNTSENVHKIVKIYLEKSIDYESKSQRKPWFEPKNLLYPILLRLIVTYRNEILNYFNWLFHFLKNLL